MELATIIKYLADQQGVSIELGKDVILFDDGYGPYIKQWNTLLMERPTEQQLLDAEESAILARDSMLMRKKRDSLLDECDWVPIKYLELGQSIPDSWVSYRNALRDLPSLPEFPNVDFPTPPEE